MQCSHTYKNYVLQIDTYILGHVVVMIGVIGVVLVTRSQSMAHTHTTHKLYTCSYLYVLWCKEEGMGVFVGGVVVIPLL